VLLLDENDHRRSLARSVPAPYVAMTSQTKLLDESRPVAAAVTYVLRSYKEPISAAITPPGVCVRSVFTHLLVSAGS
jgi:hypothetical protein